MAGHRTPAHPVRGRGSHNTDEFPTPRARTGTPPTGANRRGLILGMLREPPSLPPCPVYLARLPNPSETDLAMSEQPFTLGPYVLVEEIGRGGMGEVWRAQWIGPDGMVMPCAVKRMLPSGAAGGKRAEMFINEARVTMRLNHANICRILPIVGSEPDLFIAMEWVNGIDLKTLYSRLELGGRVLSFDTIRYILHCLLRALDHAHSLRVGGEPFPVIHRDVSPHNVMLSVNGEVKLMDFGIARVLVDETSPAKFAGKLRYSPREHLTGDVKPATDLFAVGAILHELVEGTRFRPDCETQEQMIEEIKLGRTYLLTRPGVPEWTRALHKALLQPNITDRVQTAREALSMLGRVIAEQDELGQMVRHYVGPQAGTSGSTTAHRAATPVDDADSASAAGLPGPKSPPYVVGQEGERKRRGTDSTTMTAQRSPSPARSGVRSSPGAKASHDLNGVVPRPRSRPKAVWVKVRKSEAASSPADAEPDASAPVADAVAEFTTSGTIIADSAIAKAAVNDAPPTSQPDTRSAGAHAQGTQSTDQGDQHAGGEP